MANTRYRFVTDFQKMLRNPCPQNHMFLRYSSYVFREKKKKKKPISVVNQLGKHRSNIFTWIHFQKEKK